MINQLSNTKQKLLAIIQSSKQIAVAYHPDADGMTATKILINQIIDCGVPLKNILLLPTNTSYRTLEPEQEEQVLQTKPHTLIYLDLCMQHTETARKFKKAVKHIVAIDHHYINPQFSLGYDLIINSTLFPELTKPQIHTASKILNSLFFNAKNDWLEIVGLEGDVAVPSIPGTSSWHMADILNVVGLSTKLSESFLERQTRRNNLLNCLLEARNVKDFIKIFESNRELSKIYSDVIQDVESHTQAIITLPSNTEHKKNKIFFYHIQATSGFNIIGLVLKSHAPYLGYNHTYVLYQENANQVVDVYIYSSNPAVNCFKIVTRYSGGGHTNRAGFTISQESFRSALEEVKTLIKAMIDQNIDAVTGAFKDKPLLSRNFASTQIELTDLFKNKKTFAIGYHSDADGMAATIIFLKYLHKHGIPDRSITLYPINNLSRFFDASTVDEILHKKSDIVLCIDCATSSFEQLYRLKENKFCVVCLDHHRHQDVLESIPDLYVNSTQFKELTRPETFTASKLVNSFFYDPSNNWLELVGLDGDVAIQSIHGTPIYEASIRLNTLGLIGNVIDASGEKIDVRNDLVQLLATANTVYDFLAAFNQDPRLAARYVLITKEIDTNVDLLKNLKESQRIKNHKIYLHEITTPHKQQIAERVLKEHVRYLGYNDVFIFYSTENNILNLRLYTSSPFVDCERILKLFNGGGHKSRAGLTEMALGNNTVQTILKTILCTIEEMLHDV